MIRGVRIHGASDSSVHWIPGKRIVSLSQEMYWRWTEQTSYSTALWHVAFPSVKTRTGDPVCDVALLLRALECRSISKTTIQATRMNRTMIKSKGLVSLMLFKHTTCSQVYQLMLSGLVSCEWLITLRSPNSHCYCVGKMCAILLGHHLVAKATWLLWPSLFGTTKGPNEYWQCSVQLL